MNNIIVTVLYNMLFYVRKSDAKFRLKCLNVFTVCGGSRTDVRSAGRLLLEGKEYVVADGDIITFRFNV